MRNEDYSRLAVSLSADWTTALDAFAATPENVLVYALAVQFSPESGDPALAIATEDSFERIRAKYPTESVDDLRRFGGARWNPAEFEHFDVARMSAASVRAIGKYRRFIESCSEQRAEAHAERLASALVDAILKVAPHPGLARTSSFISYVWPLEPSEQELVALARRTVDADTFDQLFPEVRRAREFMASVSLRPATEQAKFWADMLRQLILEELSEPVRILRSLGKSQHDAQQALVDVGPAAVEELVRLAEECALAEEWNERGSDEWTRRGAATRSGELASSALLALHDFSEGSDLVVRRLQHLLQGVFERDKGRALAGVNGQLIARALHALRPERFPDAEFSAKTNHLENYASYFGTGR